MSATSSIRLELANESDAGLLTEIQSRAFAEEIQLYGKGPKGFDSIDAQIRAMTFASYFKVLWESTIVGGIIVRRRDPLAGSFDLLRMYIDPRFQNQGLGSAAFQALESMIPEARKWALDTPYMSFRNHHFYEQLGFKKVGETEPSQHADVADENFHLILYEKTCV